MSAYELYLPAPPPTRNRRTGQFLKGAKPWNKGMRWDEMMPKSSQRQCAKGWKNLQKYRPKTRPDTAGRSKKQVVAVTDDGKFRIFDYIGDAAMWVGGGRENVGRCCRQNRSRRTLHDVEGNLTDRVNTDHRYMGIRFYFCSDPIWWHKVRDA